MQGYVMHDALQRLLAENVWQIAGFAFAIGWMFGWRHGRSNSADDYFEGIKEGVRREYDRAKAEARPTPAPAVADIPRDGSYCRGCAYNKELKSDG